jgi:uncharacterized protein YdiU (UPF0061 family)
MHNKLGLFPGVSNGEDNSHIINTWLDILAMEKKDYSASFRLLCEFDKFSDNQIIRDQFINRERFDEWANLYTLALTEQGVSQAQRQTQMRQHNPHIVLRNYLAQQVIDRAEEGNFEMFHEFIDALKKPYQEIEKYKKFSTQPPDWGKQLEISCSS